MNEITLTGNITDDPELRYMENGDRTPFLAFSIAVNRGYYSRAAGRWVEQAPVFHSVITFRKLAENAAQTLEKGTAVTVTGQFVDASFAARDSGRLVRRHRLEAVDIAVSLRYATAQVTRQRRQSASDTAEAPAAATVGSDKHVTEPAAV